MAEIEDIADDGTATAIAAKLRVLIGRLARAFREQTGTGQLNWSQLSVLIRLDRDGPGTVTVLARAEGMRPQSMSALISDLEAAGLVSGAPDPGDGRRTILSLTDAGLDALVASRAARQDWLARRIRSRFDPEERVQLVAAMDLFDRLMAREAAEAAFEDI